MSEEANKPITTAGNITLKASKDGCIINLPGQRQVMVSAQPMSTFEQISNLWSGAMTYIGSLDTNAPLTFIQCWQAGNLFRDTMLEILTLMGISNPLATLSPKQIEELVFWCEDTSQPIIFYIHDVGVPQVKKK